MNTLYEHYESMTTEQTLLRCFGDLFDARRWRKFEKQSLHSKFEIHCNKQHNREVAQFVDSLRTRFITAGTESVLQGLFLVRISYKEPVRPLM